MSLQMNPIAGTQVVLLDPMTIDESPSNPASRLRDIAELAKSIKAAGAIIEPLKVFYKPIDGRYEVTDGHRRRAAALALKMTGVPCIVLEPTDKPALIQLVTGMTQNKLRPWEAAQLIGTLLTSKMKAKDIAAAIGKSATVISKYKTIDQAGVKLTHAGEVLQAKHADGETLLFEDFTSLDELYTACLAILHPNGTGNQDAAKKRATEKKAGAAGQQDMLKDEDEDDEDKEAREAMAGKIAERYKLPADRVTIVNERDGMVGVVLVFSSLTAAGKALK